MRCQTHDEQAFGVCPYCGRAVCTKCISSDRSQRLACSEGCEAALDAQDRAIRLIVGKTNQSLIMTALFCYLFGGLMIAFGLVAFLFNPQYVVLFLFLGVFGIGFLIGGAFYGRLAKKRSNI